MTTKTGCKGRWRSSYRQTWAHLDTSAVRAHLEAAQGVLARLEASDRDGYFWHLWQVRVAEIQAELTSRRDTHQRRRQGKVGTWA